MTMFLPNIKERRGSGEYDGYSLGTLGSIVRYQFSGISGGMCRGTDGCFGGSKCQKLEWRPERKRCGRGGLFRPHFFPLETTDAHSPFHSLTPRLVRGSVLPAR